MVELVQKLNPQPTQEQMEKENRRKKRERIFSAISDGISALSNLYFTTQYAPNMYSGRNTASERTENKWAQLAKERDANMNAYIRMLMNAQAADDAYARGEREWARQIGIDKVKAEKDAAEEKRDREKHELDMQLMGNKISESEYNAKVAEVEAKYASQLQEAKVERERAAAGASRASASASSARAENIRSGGDKYYGEFLGKSYKTRADYEKAVLDAAKKYGVNRYEYVRDGGSNLRPEYKVKDKSIEQIAAEVDALERKKQNKKPNPMGERTQSGKKPNPMS